MGIRSLECTLILEAGHFHYMPDAGFHGQETFTYRPYDGDFEALLAVTVTITVAKAAARPSLVAGRWPSYARGAEPSPRLTDTLAG